MVLEEYQLYDIISGNTEMTDDQRRELIAELRSGSMGEHSALYEPLENMNDVDLARCALSVWVDFCRDKGLL